MLSCVLPGCEFDFYYDYKMATNRLISQYGLSTQKLRSRRIQYFIVSLMYSNRVLNFRLPKYSVWSHPSNCRGNVTVLP